MQRAPERVNDERKTGRPRRRAAAQAGSAGGDGSLLYGLHAVAAALANPSRRVLRLHATRNAAERLERLGATLPRDVRVAEPKEIDRLCGADAVHQGVALLTSPLPERDLVELGEDARLVVVLDQVTDPHNVGAILRSCAAFAVNGLVVTRRNAPHDGGVLAKAASGALEHVPILRVTNLARALESLGKRFWRVGLDSSFDMPIEDAMPADRPVALVLGAEGAGLRRLTRERCDTLARLDLPGAIASLNVSNAAALALYVATRRAASQR